MISESIKRRLDHWRQPIAERIDLLGTVALLLIILGLAMLVASFTIAPFRGSTIFQVL